MNQHFEFALANLELLITSLESQGLDDLAKLANASAGAVFDIQRLTSTEVEIAELDEQQVLDFLERSNQPLRQSLGAIFKSSTVDGIRASHPHLEQKGVGPALKMISHIEIDSTKFDIQTKSIISDCNDDVILSLMEI